MALTKISAGGDSFWLLNDVPHQRGQFDVSAKIDSDTIEIYATQSLKSLARGKFSDFSPDGITPYASTQALLTDLEAFFFRSVAGGGGGAVDSVNGQTGVVVLDADDIDDATTSNKFVTSADLTTLSNTSGTNTGDETAASIKSKYESNADTNAFTDADLTKLTALSTEVYEVYQAGTNNVPNTPTPIDFDTERAISTSFTLLAGGIVRVDQAITKLSLSYSISLDRTINDRSTASHQVYLNGLPYAGSVGYTYHRTIASGEGSVSKSVVITNLSATDTIEVRSSRVSGAATPLVSIADSSNLVIEIKEI